MQLDPRAVLPRAWARTLSLRVSRGLWAPTHLLASPRDLLVIAQTTEFYGARLYTGPLFVKYNACLRGVGMAAMEERWRLLCNGNRYTTTLHVINSAVVKLGKLQKPEKVYRGVTGGALSQDFWQADEQGVRGGCECAPPPAPPAL